MPVTQDMTADHGPIVTPSRWETRTHQTAHGNGTASVPYRGSHIRDSPSGRHSLPYTRWRQAVQRHSFLSLNQQYQADSL